MRNMEAVVGADELIVVAGAGGFIGGHLIATLRQMGYRRLRAVDIKPRSAWFQSFDDVDNKVLDLRERAACWEAAAGAAAIINLACDMGGMGFIESHKVECMLSVLINTHLLMAADTHGCRRYLYTSSACVYNQTRQDVPEVAPLREEDAYPALAEDGYGWEKLFSERMCRHFTEDRGLATRAVRLHNVYGPVGTYDGGREKAPAALCRKVITAKRDGAGEIEIWGDGLQTRSFMYIDDCVKGLLGIFASDFGDPINLGSAEMVTINELADMVETIAGIRLARRHEMDRPKGVRGRSSDNTLIRKVLGWEPSTPLKEGLIPTYAWIEREIREDGSPIFRMP